jgi:hypothetical protein
MVVERRLEDQARCDRVDGDPALPELLGVPLASEVAMADRMVRDRKAPQDPPPARDMSRRMTAPLIRDVAVTPFARGAFAIRAQRLAYQPSSNVSATHGREW